jgi:hypothetical protein
MLAIEAETWEVFLRADFALRVKECAKGCSKQASALKVRSGQMRVSENGLAVLLPPKRVWRRELAGSLIQGPVYLKCE